MKIWFYADIQTSKSFSAGMINAFFSQVLLWQLWNTITGFLAAALLLHEQEIATVYELMANVICAHCILYCTSCGPYWIILSAQLAASSSWLWLFICTAWLGALHDFLSVHIFRMYLIVKMMSEEHSHKMNARAFSNQENLMRTAKEFESVCS